VAISSVVPGRNRAWARAARELGVDDVLWVKHDLRLDVKLAYPDPASIGADRLANACAAVQRYGAPVIVADFGTALTFDVVSPARAYLGGIIAPGLPLMFDYLAEKTALLPHIRPGTARHPIGKSTEEAMRLGARHGYRGMVREILEHVRTRMKWKKCAFCATGGYAPWVLKGLGLGIKHDEDLTLFGVGRVFDLNRGREQE
jgi:type III pantothenate kinase